MRGIDTYIERYDELVFVFHDEGKVHIKLIVIKRLDKKCESHSCNYLIQHQVSDACDVDELMLCHSFLDVVAV